MHEAHIKSHITQRIQTAVAEVDYNISFLIPIPKPEALIESAQT